MIYIITGHYGSGKTEIALHLALSLKQPTVIDLDIVNPYFRTEDAREVLAKAGVRLISPQFANTNVDIPAVPAEVLAALQGGGDVVIDVGGDDDGAVVLGRYNAYLREVPYEMYFVINKRRPLTACAEDVIRMIQNVEAASRLSVTKLMNNTHIKTETTAADVLDGQTLVEEVSHKTGIPLGAIAGTRGVVAGIKTNLPLMPLELRLNLPWERGV
ncbi:MAG: hypothetical protein LBH54_05460 [Clostridiales bacterium]|jgi:hypothetical protein|nr:hypothetical protein [Clostridiales bacterium]